MSSIDKYAQYISRQQKTLEFDGKLISEREVLINRLMAEGYTSKQIEFMIEDSTLLPGLIVNRADKKIGKNTSFNIINRQRRTLRGGLNQSNQFLNKNIKASSGLNDDPTLNSKLARQAAGQTPANSPGIKYPDPTPLTPREAADAPKPVFSKPPSVSPPRRSTVNAVLDNRLVGMDTSDAIGGKPSEPAKGYEGSIPTRTKGPPVSARQAETPQPKPVSVEDPDALAKTLQAKQTPSPAQGARAAAEILPGEGRKPAAASSAPAQDAKPTARPAATQSRSAPSAKGEYGPSGYDPTATRERRREGNKIVRVEKPADFRKTVFDR